MQHKDARQFTTEMETLCEAFGREVTERLICVYWSALEDLPLPAIQAAVKKACREHAFFPVPAKLREMCDASTRMKAVEAWPEVMRLAARSSGEHSDPIAREAIRLMGGGRRLGQMNTEDLEVWGRKQFESYYDEVQKRQSMRPSLPEKKVVNGIETIAGVPRDPEAETKMQKIVDSLGEKMRLDQ